MLDRIRIQYCCARFHESSTRLMGDTSELAHELHFLLREGWGLVPHRRRLRNPVAILQLVSARLRSGSVVQVIHNEKDLSIPLHCNPGIVQVRCHLQGAPLAPLAPLRTRPLVETQPCRRSLSLSLSLSLEIL